MSPRNGATKTSYFNNGQSITCNPTTFGISDPDSGTVKLCKIKGYTVAKDGETFTVNVNANINKYCHGSTIPYDLSGDVNASVSLNGWASDLITKDTYKTSTASVNGNITKTNDGNNNTSYSSGSVICQSDGTWRLGSGQMTLNYTESIVYAFKIPAGSKKSNKSFTIELWGAQGGSPNIYNYGGYGGYTKIVSQLGNKFGDGAVLYPVVGGRPNGGTGGYNGGGNSASGFSGGGATHIATKQGLLSSLSGSKSSVIAVAGGGGGTGGVNPYMSQGGGNNNTGGSGSSCNANGTFGKGANGNGPAGGGGYTGGCSTYTTGGNFNGGGGSGYCNTSYGSCSGSNGARSGNGYAKISW